MTHALQPIKTLQLIFREKTHLVTAFFFCKMSNVDRVTDLAKFPVRISKDEAPFFFLFFYIVAVRKPGWLETKPSKSVMARVH